jgi:hypothetical protein
MDSSILNKDKLWNKIKKYMYYVIIFLFILIILIFYNIIISHNILMNQKNINLLKASSSLQSALQ